MREVNKAHSTYKNIEIPWERQALNVVSLLFIKIDHMIKINE